MYYLYFVSTFQTITLKNGNRYNTLANGTVKLRYPIGDFESLMLAEKLIAKDTMNKNPEIADMSVTITSYQHISSNPF